MTVEPEAVALLQRALAQRRDDDWERLYAVLSPRVQAWVHAHPSFRLSGEDADYFTNRALERLWQAVDPAKAARFQEGPALLQYLKLCVHSVIMDELRGPAPKASERLDELTPSLPDPSPGPEDQALASEERDALWSLVARVVRGARERLLLEASFVRGLPPREIAARFPALFASVQEVYTLKRRVLERLARSPELEDFLARRG
ncbi:RNA polymerase sigma factor [Limnochorda pilosa]|uniref:RNA polymerase sigma-70 region 2 domain-containing protein n=1 Tax=Limnochorda pilosa TaxID=1555112 RepID=A0A0K2SKF5_LIMPI|nr:sigma-70 family RNA polymerase sigma factor [Limnochorda pilosa]BAS27319.1 hypothetical protein LIP_1470 [Limnochorda pilosa]